MKTSKTKVVIVGGGPAGLMLSHILGRYGIDNAVVERHSMEHVASRIRAGVLEYGTAQLLKEHGLAERMLRDGKAKNGALIVWENRPDFFIDLKKWTGKQMWAWGQTYIQEDLHAALTASGAQMIHEAADVALHDITDDPSVTYVKDGVRHQLKCDFICGCDGFHGPSRQAIPLDVRREYERVYPFAWLGIMVERPPLENFTYAYHSDGMAMAAQRNPMLSRYYVQTPLSDRIEDWPDDRFWATLLRRLPENLASQVQTGPSIEKSMAPLRSFVSEPLRWGKLFLAGDAGHIVPPTGAKGLNLAFSDVFYLSRALRSHYLEGSDHYLETYSEMALRRIWASENISWRLTKLLHVFPDEVPFDQKIRESDYDLLLGSEPAQQALAHEYLGLPFEE
ncbi:4-hydroxybenzoate 3-monooxygenase [Roseibium aggregatum]|uniref:4-hydroxybenzoate 3-monooxygenase n=1 Tax=Roseibium aggregatum TaxID=187304 RepID=A0A926S2X8_9HYPH|nr:4-hydroxybenzoate 3-monooxygenase [Roseibium aggregatum]MBD1544718.1 4-hydroxybenzoate 3-monooxygenase [Roseibium aggregatum]